MSFVRRQEWSGPLPPPQALAAFDEVVPGLAKQIADSALEEGKARRRNSERESKTSMFQGIAGTIFAFLLSAGLIGGGIYLLALGKTVESLFAFGGALVPVISGFLAKRSNQ